MSTTSTADPPARRQTGHGSSRLRYVATYLAGRNVLLIGT